MPNIIAYAAISIWPLIVIYLIKRYGVERGILISLLGCYMFLPAGFNIDLPLLPPFNKFSVTTITITAFLFFSGKRIGFISLSPKMKWLVIALVLSPFLTAITNQESYIFLPALSLYDGLTDSVIHFLYFIPFIFGVYYFRRFEHQIMLFKMFAVAALIYAFFALYEIRMSPQLHVNIYGYFPHSWLQQYREGGFRAVVFMGHGLLVAFFLALGVGFLSALKVNKIRLLSINNTALLIFLLLTLVLMKSVAALVFGLFAFLLITFFSRKLMHLASLGIVVMFLTYPTLSAMQIFPHKNISELAGMISPERQQSLNYRFDNETILLAHASQKPLFGWGGWGRNRVFDAETGEDISTTDGKWIITLGIRGWFGFLAEFLFFVVPVWLAYKLQGKKNIPKKEQFFLAIHALIVTIILLDQMPNASMNALYWLVVGSLLGRVYEISDGLKNKVIEPAQNKTEISKIYINSDGVEK